MEFFNLLAICTITLAGFSAIHAQLQRTTGPRGAFRSLREFGTAALAFFISIFPLLFNLLEISEASIWSIASALAAICLIVFFIVVLRINGKLTANGFLPETSPAIALVSLLIVVSAILFTGNVFPWSDAANRFIYGLGVLLLMIVPVSAMAVSFIVSPEQPIKHSENESADSGQ